jgi:hypothetical protein
MPSFCKRVIFTFHIIVAGRIVKNRSVREFQPQFWSAGSNCYGEGHTALEKPGICLYMGAPTRYIDIVIPKRLHMIATLYIYQYNCQTIDERLTSCEGVEEPPSGTICASKLEKVKAEWHSSTHCAGDSPSFAQGNEFYRIKFLGIIEKGWMPTQTPMNGYGHEWSLYDHTSLPGNKP